MTPKQRHNLERLLAPRNVAVIGGDDAAIAAEQCAAIGFAGPIWGVNPRRKELGGQTCFERIENLPEPPDAVFLAIPRRAAVETVEALRESGAGGVVCFTAGFSEADEEGAELERALVAAAGDLALVGPNCYGLLNYVRGVALWPFVPGGQRVDRGIAIVSQSGMLASNLTMNQRSVALSYVISAGNQGVLGIHDYLEVLVGDPAVSAIGLYVEELPDVPRFGDIAVRALNTGVPIVAVKVGSSDIGSRLAISHTGSLSGSDEAYQALFDRLGIVRVDTPALLLETLKMLTMAGAPKGRRLAAFTCSGGDTALLADLGERAGISFKQPSREAARELAHLLSEIATVSNPLDYTTPLWGNETALTVIFRTMLADGYDTALLAQDYPIPEIGTSLEQYHADARAFLAATRAAGIPAAVCSGLSESLDGETREMLIAAGVAPLQGTHEALAAIDGAAAYGERRARFESPAAVANFSLTRVPQTTGECELLNEWEGKQALAAAGVTIPEGRLADATEAPAVAEKLGFPVVVKLLSEQLPHKSEVGVVRLGLNNAPEVAEAIVQILQAVARHIREVASQTFLVERMVTKPVAEVLIGIRRDERFGQIMVLSSGGTFVELVGDARTLLLPTDREAVSGALSSLKLSALLAGFRGRPPGDKEGLVDAVLALARFAEERSGEIVELDVNPLMVLQKGVIAVDVLLRKSRTRPAREG